MVKMVSTKTISGLLLCVLFIVGCGDRTKKDLSQTCPQEEKNVPPTEDLMREHGVLRRCLLIYDYFLTKLGDRSAEQLPYHLLAETADIIHRFIEEYHEKLEERYIFPLFEQDKELKPLVDALVRQHETGRVMTAQIQKLLGDPARLEGGEERAHLVQLLKEFIAMYAVHAAREDTVLFSEVRLHISEQAFAALGETFEDSEEELFGEQGFEKIVKKVRDIEQKLGIYELA